jgi:hypothetical protein
MQLAIWLALAVIVAFVAIDALSRRERPPHPDEAAITTDKITVDLTRRR